MISDIIENEDYKKLIEKQIKESIEFLLNKDQEFSITANIEAINFEPELPNSIKKQMQKFSLFILSNYLVIFSLTSRSSWREVLPVSPISS